MMFPGLGPCTQYFPDGMVHQYGEVYHKKLREVDLTFFDITSASCLNSWTGGNLAAPSSSLANMVHEIYTSQILKPSTVKDMVQWKTLGSTDGGFTYGLGTMGVDIADFQHANTSAPWFTV